MAEQLRTQIVPAAGAFEVGHSALLATAYGALAAAASLPDITHLVDRAEVIRVAARAAGLSVEGQNAWLRYKIDCQRAAADQIEAMRAAGELAPRGGDRKSKSEARTLILEDLGIRKQRAAEWTKLAAVAEPELDAAFAAATEAGRLLSESAVITMGAAQKNREQLGGLRLASDRLEGASGPFRTIVIDPPWDMKKIEREVRPHQAGFDYPTMNELELFEYPLRDVMDEACHVYLWTTQRHLPLAFELLKAWGLQYVFTMVWHKSGGFQPVGLPQYNCEFALFGHRATLPFLDTKAFPTCFQAPRREHSRKPIEFYDLVRRVSPSPRVDIFSREAHEGFSQLGNEIDRFSADAEEAG